MTTFNERLARGGDLADTGQGRADRRERPDRWRRADNGLGTILVQYGPYRAGWGWHVWPTTDGTTLAGVPSG
jgi:hypothetical protein